MKIGFRPLREGDLPMLREWIARPHWQEWWGDPDEEIGHIRDMIEGRDSTRPFIFELDGTPCGYIQVWSIQDQTEEWVTEYPWLAELPRDAVGVDLSIADAARLGKGIGSAALAAFVARLRAEGNDVIIIDPDRANTRAARAYARAGFRPVPALEGLSGDVLIMQHQPDGGGT
jgi:RimJ/RimL family protein N-acetyltransferase